MVAGRDPSAGSPIQVIDNASDSPLNAVSVALRRLVQRNRVVKVADGFRLPTDDVLEADTLSA